MAIGGRPEARETIQVGVSPPSRVLIRLQYLRDRRRQPTLGPGADLRREPLETRKATLASVLRRATSGLRLNEHLQHEDSALVLEHACHLGLEGIVSKRKGSAYRSGRTTDWLKAKNPNAPAMTRLADEDWSRRWTADTEAVCAYASWCSPTQERVTKTMQRQQHTE